MEISEDSLRKLIACIVEKVKAELSTKQEKVFVILAEGCKTQIPAFFENLEKNDNYHMNTIITPSMESNYQQILKYYKTCGTIFNRDEINNESLSQYTTVFPFTPREVIVKTALGIDDTFETKWIRNCFEKGQKVILLSSGFERFTGKEPTKYIQTMQNYFKTILEYGIEIKTTFNSNENTLYQGESSFFTMEQKAVCSQKQEKRVITTVDIEKCGRNGQLILQKGDIITSLAEDRAKESGVHIIRN